MAREISLTSSWTRPQLRLKSGEGQRRCAAKRYMLLREMYGLSRPVGADQTTHDGARKKKIVITPVGDGAGPRKRRQNREGAEVLQEGDEKRSVEGKRLVTDVSVRV